MKKICFKSHYNLPSTYFAFDAYWRRQWQPTPVLLPGKSHGLRSLVGCSPWDREESDTMEWLHFHFSLSSIGEGNGNPLQCSCLENPRDGEPGGLPSMGSHRVGHDWSDLAAVYFEDGLSKDQWYRLKELFCCLILLRHYAVPILSLVKFISCELKLWVVNEPS